MTKYDFKFKLKVAKLYLNREEGEVMSFSVWYMANFKSIVMF